MEGARVALIQITESTIGTVQRESAVHLWAYGLQAATPGRLKILSDLRDQPTEIDNEFGNIRASIDWLKNQREHGAAELFIAYLQTLDPYLRLRGKGNELANWCMDGLNTCEILKKNPARILLSLGNAQYSLGQWNEANESWQAAITASKDRDPVTHAHTVAALGQLQANQGKYKTALNTLAHAQQLLDGIGDTEVIIGVRSEVASYHLNRRELDKALELYLEIEALHKKNGAKESSNHITLMLGVIYRQKRIFDKATEYLSELCRRSETHRDMSSLATGSHHLAWVHFELGEFEQARTLCGKALALYDNLKDPRGLSDGYEQLGAILLEAGKLEEAIDSLKQSIQVRQEIGNDPGSISSLRRLALAYMMRGDRMLAARLSIRVLIRYIDLGILSRHRIFALLRDFLAGVIKVTLYKTRENRAISVMENFSSTLIRPVKQAQTRNEPEP